jgi:hypothetical protein
MSQEIPLERGVRSSLALPRRGQQKGTRKKCFLLRNQQDWDAILCHCLQRSVCVRGQYVNSPMIFQEVGIGVHFGKKSKI